MEDESGATPSVTDGVHSSDIQGDQMVRESIVTRSIVDEIHS